MNPRLTTYELTKNHRVSGSSNPGEEIKKISEIFATNVFGLAEMFEYLPERQYEKIVESLKKGKKIDLETAETVAKGMKKWAMDKGATHFTHWFQPMTGSTAEKHDAFFKPSMDYRISGVESLSAAELVQREPDASSFPSGGLRNTAQARGYSIWDPGSPAFILETALGKTLYIPSVYISYTGESLDHKTPLLKSIEVLNKAATAVCHYFDESVTNVISTLGWEQEYFLIDQSLYRARPDLMLTGRTLVGGNSAKNQQLEDHYFGSIPERVQDFIHDFEKEALKLGVPVLTRHNEVAPAQYECAPMFEELNVAVDHNLLCMEVLSRVATRHGLQVLLHEKPFAGVNGSGKHNNWSMATGDGRNLLSPGKDPGSNLSFLTFFIIVVKAINDNEELLRTAIAYPGNDHRLGANEAPPAIISVFTGSNMATILEGFKLKGLASGIRPVSDDLSIDVPTIPNIIADSTDRNRTSPFPFTGNKFEFRAVGSSANCAPPMTVLNTMVADVLVAFKTEVDAKIAAGQAKQAAIESVLMGYIADSERIIFNGDGYSEEWQAEAAKRGLSNNKNTPAALAPMVSPKAEALFSRHKIFTKKEMHARYEVALENYIKKLEIEAQILEELINTHVVPAAVDYLAKIGTALTGLADARFATSKDGLANRAGTIANYLTALETEFAAFHKAKASAGHAADRKSTRLNSSHVD